jgi:hypothetical protein
VHGPYNIKYEAVLSQEEKTVVFLDVPSAWDILDPTSVHIFCGGQNKNGADFYPSTSDFSCQPHSIYAPHSFVNPSPMLHNPGK